MISWVIIGIIVLSILWLIWVYNQFIALKNDVRNAWSQIDIQLKRRHDLIPNLVTVVRGYMHFEKQTIEAVTLARAKAMAASSVHEKAAAENLLTQALGRLFALIENYPVLKNSESVMSLMEELVTTENRIAFSRQLYND